MRRRKELIEQAQEIEQHLRAIRQALRQPLENDIARGNLTGPQTSVMQALVQSGGMSLKELSQAVGLAHSTVSGIVDRLEKRGMVKRQADAEDRRFSRIMPSAAVQTYVRETLPNLTLHPLARALARANSADRAMILAGIRALRRVLVQASN
jgi:DNA-binding MarR family transcriptional regulator